MKIPFDIKFKPQIESGEYKVVTSFGEPAEIVKWDCKGQYPLLACIFDGDTDDAAFYTEEGKGVCNSKENYLFLITPDPELSEFEKELSRCLCDSNVRPEEEDYDKWAKEYAPALLNIARNEIVKSGYAIVESKHYLEEGRKNYERGKEEALEDLPRWKEGSLPTGHAAIDIDGLCGFDFIRRRGKLIEISSIEKLPGFNE